MTCKHLMRSAEDCVFCERDRLRKENESLRVALLGASLAAQRVAEDAMLSLSSGISPDHAFMPTDAAQILSDNSPKCGDDCAHAVQTEPR